VLELCSLGMGGVTDLKINAPPPRYLAVCERCALNGVAIDRELHKFGSAGVPSPWGLGMADP